MVNESARTIFTETPDEPHRPIVIHATEGLTTITAKQPDGTVTVYRIRNGKLLNLELVSG